jgi:hypothetical protein
MDRANLTGEMWSVGRCQRSNCRRDTGTLHTIFFISTRVMHKISRHKPFDYFLIVNSLIRTSSTLPLRMKQERNYGTLPRRGTKDAISSDNYGERIRNK